MVTLKDILELINPDSDVAINYEKGKYINGTAYNRVSPYLNTPVKEIRHDMDEIIIELEVAQTVEEDDDNIDPRLKDGYVVELQNGERYVVLLKLKLLEHLDKKHTIPLSLYGNGGLKCCFDTREWDIERIYNTSCYLVWERN